MQPSQTNTAIVADSAENASNALTPGQALGQLAHYERRLRRRTRAYFAARERLTLAREEFAHVEGLAANARTAWPMRAA